LLRRDGVTQQVDRLDPAWIGHDAAAQFWWVVGILGSISGTMLWFFRRHGWIRGPDAGECEDLTLESAGN
jgi:hypothetical protein